VSREDVIRKEEEEEVDPRTGRPRRAAVGVDPALRPSPSPTPRRGKTHFQAEEIAGGLRELRQKSVGSALDIAVGGVGFFRYDRADNEKLIQELVRNYGANPLHAEKILQLFSRDERLGREVKVMSPSDYVDFLVRFHPLVHENERPIPGNAANRGYKISEIYDLLFHTPFWFFVSPGKEADAEALYKRSLKRYPGAVFGRESWTESHTIVLGWYDKDTNKTSQIRFVRKFTNADPIKGQALYYQPIVDPALAPKHFRTIQDAARAVALLHGLEFLPDKDKYSRKVSRLTQTSKPVGSHVLNTRRVEAWSTEDVKLWLMHKGFPEEVQEIFLEEAISGDVLFNLTPYILKDMGIEDAKQRTKILKALMTLRSEKWVKDSPYMRSLAPLPEEEEEEDWGQWF
jgi:hypothetical protein